MYKNGLLYYTLRITFQKNKCKKQFIFQLQKTKISRDKLNKGYEGDIYIYSKNYKALIKDF